MKTAITSMLVGMLALGTVIGLLVGLSQSPVVGVVLPLLFSLFGAAGGFFVLKTDFSEAGPQRALLVYSLCLICISLGTGGGVYWGSSQKAVRTTWSLLGLEKGDFPPRGAQNEDALSWVLLDARLNFLGLSADQRESFIHRVHVPTNGAPTFTNRLSGVGEALRTAMPGEGVVEQRNEWLAVLHQVLLLQSLASDQEVAPLELLAAQLGKLEDQLHLLRDDEDDRAYIEATDGASILVAQLEARVAKFRAAIDASRSPVDFINEQLDIFLDQHAGSVKAAATGGIQRSIASVGGLAETMDS